MISGYGYLYCPVLLFLLLIIAITTITSTSSSRRTVRRHRLPGLAMIITIIIIIIITIIMGTWWLTRTARATRYTRNPIIIIIVIIGNDVYLSKVMGKNLACNDEAPSGYLPHTLNMYDMNLSKVRGKMVSFLIMQCSEWVSLGWRVPVQEELPRPHTLLNRYFIVLRDGQAWWSIFQLRW